VTEAEAVLATEVEEIEVVDVADEVHEEEVTRRRRSGSQSPSSVDLSRPARSRAWSRSTYTPCPSKSTRSWIGSCPS